MSERIDNDRWAATWGVPAETATIVRSHLRAELHWTWNTARTRHSTGPVHLFDDHLQRPGQTGMYLLEKMGVDLTPLPKDLQHLITSTSCQHRTEWLYHPTCHCRYEGAQIVHEEFTIPQLSYYDGRAMYLGCCQGIGIAGGHYTHTEGEDINGDERGRARVRFEVPAWWWHVGLLAGQGLTGWEWPFSPGVAGETWADLCEIRYARSWGWHVEVLEKITWPEDRPLDLWAQRLSRLYLTAKEENNEPLAGCYRSIALHTIGRFHNLGYRDAREVVEASDPRATFDTIQSVGADGVHIKTRVAVDKPERECHPEWSAAIWSKVHLRVAKALMSVPRESILAVRGDAIYLAQRPPVGAVDDPWKDDGRTGQLRLKRWVEGPLPAPRNWSDLRSICDGD